jgi:hypothetical protein
MKNKLRSIFTTTAATLATVVVGATSASAASLYETLLPYTPIEDNPELEGERGLQADGVNLIEYDLPDFTNLGADYDSIDVMFLGESAGYQNTLQLSLNEAKTSIFEDINAYDGSGAIKDGDGREVGTFDSQYNGLNPDRLDIGTIWNSKDVGIEGFSKGDNLNFWLNPNGDATTAFNMGTTASLGYGGLRSDIPLFKAYQLTGFEDWTILAVEDIDYWDSPHLDHNDLVFAVKLNPSEDIPEPSTIIGLLGVAGAGLVLRRKSLTK